MKNEMTRHKRKVARKTADELLDPDEPFAGIHPQKLIVTAETILNENRDVDGNEHDRHDRKIAGRAVAFKRYHVSVTSNMTGIAISLELAGNRE
jgi:hypothetical protein